MSEVAPVIRLRGLSKRFGEVLACDEVSLDVKPGEVHCLLGENGAGKSTLISLLAGLQQASSGSIEVDGAATVLATPAAAIAAGIAVVYQHSTLVPTMKVLENLMLPGGGMRLQRREAEQQLATLNRTLHTAIAPEDSLGSLALGQQQQFEIARAVARRPRVLILDEPTSMLSDAESDALLETVRDLASRGVAIVLVTHKLREALAVADVVTVLRAGRVAERVDRSEVDSHSAASLERRILTAMFSAEPGDAEAADPMPVPSNAPSALSVVRLCTPAGQGTPLEDLTCSVRRGEVLGIAGIDGNGQHHLAEVIAGQRRATSGQIMLQARDVTGASVRARQRLGLRYLTDDRLHEGIIGRFSVTLNLVLKRIGERPLWRFGREDHDAVQREARRLVDTFDVRTPALETPAGTLSGGNIQKILLARELSSDAKVVIAHKPSHGLDVGTVQRVRDEIRAFAAAGGAVLLISSDLDELTALSHRIAVISGGRIVGEVSNTGEGVRHRVGELIAGGVPA